MNSMIIIGDLLLGASNAAFKLDEEDSEKFLKEAKTCYDLGSKSIRAFFMSNEKEEFVTTKFDDSIGVFKKRNFVASTDVDSLKNLIIEKLGLVAVELAKHESDIVFHDNGKNWKKTKADKKRFASMVSSIESMTKIVS